MVLSRRAPGDRAVLELLPGVGVLLPSGAELRFGASADEVREVLGTAPRTHLDLQCASLRLEDCEHLRDAHDAWLSGFLYQPAWNTVAEFDDLVVTVCGGGPSRSGELVAVAVNAHPGGSTSHVAWEGVDLFGHPAPDVLDALPDPVRLTGSPDIAVPPLGLRLRPGIRLHGRDAGADRWSALVLLAGATGWERCCAGAFTCEAGGNGFAAMLG